MQPSEEKKPDDIEGYSLFPHIADRELRMDNQATTLVNILEDNTKKGKPTAGGKYLAAKYWGMLDEGDKKEVESRMLVILIERRFK